MMTFRKTLFWLHLVAGLIAGLSIGIMCFTGTVASPSRNNSSPGPNATPARSSRPPPGTPRLPLAELSARLRAAQPEVRPQSIVLQNDPLAAVAFTTGRNEQRFYVNPYTGEVRQPASSAMADFMHLMTDWHRYLALSGEHRPVGKLINGICNLAFCVLAVTGLYLWMPRTWSWRAVCPIDLVPAERLRQSPRFQLAQRHRPLDRARPDRPHPHRRAHLLPLGRHADLHPHRHARRPPKIPPAPAAAPPRPRPPSPRATPVATPPPAGRPLRRRPKTVPAAWQLLARRTGTGGGPAGRGNRGSATTPGRSSSPPAPPIENQKSKIENPTSALPAATLTVRESASWPRTAATTLTVRPLHRRSSCGATGYADLNAARNRSAAWTRFLHTGEALGPPRPIRRRPRLPRRPLPRLHRLRPFVAPIFPAPHSRRFGHTHALTRPIPAHRHTRRPPTFNHLHRPPHLSSRAPTPFNALSFHAPIPPLHHARLRPRHRSAAGSALAATPLAPSATTAPVVLPSFQVEAEAESDHYVQGPFLPDVQGAKINVGKKTSILDFDSQPRINGNNYRQALAQAPGLVLSEETSPLVSIGYRGLEPHRAQFTQVLKDGIPIHADQFGYPEAYYTPPLDTVDRIEFTRGGAALLYGPQPGGALNYVTHRPRTDRPFSGSTLHTAGSDGYYSTFSHLDGTVGRIGYYGYFNHRSSDGIRSANSDYSLDRLAWPRCPRRHVQLPVAPHARNLRPRSTASPAGSPSPPGPTP
jgi:hypothetical protein